MSKTTQNIDIVTGLHTLFGLHA